MNIQKIVKIAKDKWKRSDINRHKVIALALFGGKMLYAVNRRGEGRVSRFSYHAEELLVKKIQKERAIQRLGIPVVVILRPKRDGQLGESRPCRGCTSLLKGIGVQRAYYVASNYNGSMLNNWGL